MSDPYKHCVEYFSNYQEVKCPKLKPESVTGQCSNSQKLGVTLNCNLEHTHAREYSLIATFFSGEALEYLLLSTYLNPINIKKKWGVLKCVTKPGSRRNSLPWVTQTLGYHTNLSCPHISFLKRSQELEHPPPTPTATNPHSCATAGKLCHGKKQPHLSISQH